MPFAKGFATFLQQGICNLPAICAKLAKGFATFLQFAQDLQRGLQPSYNLRGACKVVCNLPAICAELAKGFAAFLQPAQSLQPRLQR